MFNSFRSRPAIAVAERANESPGHRRAIATKRVTKRAAVASATLVAATTASVWAFQPLPPGQQVNDDPAAGIDKTLSVSGESPANADLVGGALTAGKRAVPWAIFRQQESNGAPPPHDQVFARSFAGGAWTTRGSGTVGGRSSAAPQFPGSLNFDQGSSGEAPSIDFAGSERTVPWATWYENTSGVNFENNNVFASRFDNTGDANQGKWIFAGQARGNGGGTTQVPSLNIDTNQAAENPSVAGGSAVDPSKPGPWVTFQEFSGLEGVDQVFAVRPIGPGASNCDGIKPEGVRVEGHVPAIGGFCWQQTGAPRVGEEPSLNVDTSREGVEPDIAFAGAKDAVPWVVWYEKGKSSNELDQNEQVFAAEAVSDDHVANGGFHWVVVGNALSGALDTTGPHHLGKCGESQLNEGLCSLNRDANANAENPRVAAGTMNPANPTVPWVTWDEEIGGVKQVFVSHLVGSGTSAHFDLANGGEPISSGRNDATRPSITFSGNTPYVSWREDVGGVSHGFTGHFVNPATFVTDSSEISLTPREQADVREPISSACIATPFNGDGASCQGGALGTPFLLTTAGTAPLGLFAVGYDPDAPITGAATGIGSAQATASGTVNPRGASVAVSFEYGTTTAYGQSTTPERTAPASDATPFSGELTGLPAGTTIHYRAVAVSDFGKFTGADRTLVTASVVPPSSPPAVPPAPSAHGSVASVATSGSIATLRVSCRGQAGATCQLRLALSVTETVSGRKLVALTASRKRRTTHRVVVVGRANVVLAAGETRSVQISLNAIGKRLLARRHRLRTSLTVNQLGAGAVAAEATVVTFRGGNARGHH
jgi:hypothetical protein